MDKNKQQLIILAAVVTIFIAATAMSIFRPHAKEAGKEKNAAGAPGATSPAAAKPAPQRERLKSSFGSWGRDPFAIGSGAAELGSGPASLSGIFCDPKKSYCIIDGKVAKVGDEVSGYKILEINKDSVTVKAGDEIRTLRIGR